VSGNGAPWAGRRLHFVGAGGAGMSGYARAASALGAQVSGSDCVQTPYLAQLRSDGVLEATIGYDARNVPAGEETEVFYSSAVPAENPERAAARERGLPERPRADLLGELSALRRTIAVAGTHGKTTTSAMIVHALRGAGADPGWMIGGTIGEGLANSHWSAGEWLVIEADESDRSMLSLNVEIGVLTNAELDHHAAYTSLADLMGAYEQFLARAPQAVIWDRPQLLALRHAPYVAYDLQSCTLFPGGSRFAWRGHEVKLSVPGAHNALNATAALEAVRLTGAQEQAAIEGLAGFHGAGRRFQRLGHTASGALVVDDYAHHPTEVSATIAAARAELAPDGGRLVAVFQPHLYSRTALLADEFGAALAQADLVAVLDVYAARECQQDHPDVSGLAIARAAAEHAEGRQVMWLPQMERARSVLRGLLRDGDLCLAMGAGDVDSLGRGLVGQ
jgi:UDP-N-acetylmuramate--alanine ligase